MLKAGVDISKTKLIQNINGVIKCGGKVVQFYMGPKISWSKGNPLAPNDIKKINELRIFHGLMPFVHSKLIINLCHIDNNDAVNSLIYDLTAANEFGADVVVHQGKNVSELGLNRIDAINAYVNNIKKVLEATPGLTNHILLENSCQQGSELGYTVEELSTIWSLFDNSYKDRLGFCIDLCHIHVAGTMNVSDHQSVIDTFQEFHKLIGLQHIRLIHFNDSNIPFGKKNDCHEDILVGHIGNPLLGGSSNGFKQIIKYAIEYQIPLLLETPNIIPYSYQINLLLSWENIPINTISSYEQKYIEQFKVRIEEFGNNPISRKGNKKQAHCNTNVPKLSIPVINDNKNLPTKKKILILKKKNN